jgi:hypothetical protein
VSRLAPAPGKYYVMAIVLTAALFVGGWPGLALVAGFLLLEQYGAESTKAIFKRPRPSADLIATHGKFTGYTFPSTTITFFSVTFGVSASSRWCEKCSNAATGMDLFLMVSGCLARAGAHYRVTSSTALICLVCPSTARVVLGNA